MSRVPEPESTPEGPAYEGRLLARPEEEVVDQGAGFDISTLLSRRRILGLFGAGVGAAALAACGSSGNKSSGSGSSGSGSSGNGSTSEGEIPQETNGPYPADGTNGTNVLTESGIVRSDITSSLDGGTTVDGVPLDFTFTVTDMAGGDVPFEGVAVYLWQCDAQGRYSMYSEGVENETYLRGVQIADAKGQVSFKTIVPGCYDGRWTHMHFEVYPDAATATTGENAIATSQVAFPAAMLKKVYQDDTYSGSTENLAKVSLETDNVFSDGVDLQMGTFTGSPSAGYQGSLAVAVDTTTEATMGGAPGGAMGGGDRGGLPPQDGQGGTPPEPPN